MCGMEKRVIIMEIGVLPSLGEYYLLLILYDALKISAIFSVEEKVRGEKIEKKKEENGISLNLS